VSLVADDARPLPSDIREALSHRQVAYEPGDGIVATESTSLHLATKAIELAGRVDHALQVRGHPYLAPVYTSALELFGVLALRGAEELTCLNIRGLRSTQYKPWKLVAGRPHLDKAKRHPWDNSNPRPPL